MMRYKETVLFVGLDTAKCTDLMDGATKKQETVLLTAFVSQYVVKIVLASLKTKPNVLSIKSMFSLDLCRQKYKWLWCCFILNQHFAFKFQHHCALTQDYRTNFAQFGAMPLWLITGRRAAQPSIDHFLITSDPDKSHTLDDDLNHRQAH